MVKQGTVDFCFFINGEEPVDSCLYINRSCSLTVIWNNILLLALFVFASLGMCAFSAQHTHMRTCCRVVDLQSGFIELEEDCGTHWRLLAQAADMCAYSFAV
jgi:hypothetical protein